MKFRVWCNSCNEFVGVIEAEELNICGPNGDSIPYREHLLEAHSDRSVTLSYSVYGGSEHMVKENNATNGASEGSDRETQ